METFVAFVVIVLGLFALEFYYVFTGQPTISERIRNVNKIWRSLGFLSVLVASMLLGHFFLGPGTPTSDLAGIIAACVFGLIAGAIWFR